MQRNLQAIGYSEGITLLLRPFNVSDERYDNMQFTAQGLRLIDVGISVLQQ
ncbi:hypothetical protein [Hymenobacter sp. IS2118]|uniref:hypothetical protein n=1 Tax=Hymenobacter sp. IS2118 TaxID=1505605 RepID=UPI000A973A88|nr:hypothetical protein [Hymenobacter sp. IS2118]